MADEQSMDIRVRDKQEMAGPTEQTTPGLVFTPAVDIFETEKAITLLADLPGTKAEDLSIDLRDDTLTLTADITPVDTSREEEILTEYETGRYYRQFTLGEMINQEGIDAKLESGVLRLTLPKIEKATPRKIVVKTG